jgi:hypothetical protein
MKKKESVKIVSVTVQGQLARIVIWQLENASVDLELPEIGVIAVSTHLLKLPPRDVKLFETAAPELSRLKSGGPEHCLTQLPSTIVPTAQLVLPQEIVILLKGGLLQIYSTARPILSSRLSTSFLN